MFTIISLRVYKAHRLSVLLYTLILLLLNSASCLSREQERDSPCVVEVYSSSDSVLIYLIIPDSCNLPYQGFEIVKLHYWTGWEVLWGRGETEECSTRYYLLDLDEDGRDEIFTLFEDENNIWGYVHRYQLLDQGGVALQTLPIPFILTDDVLYRDRCSINVNGTFTLLGETYEGDEHLTVYYDADGDSLALRAGW